MLDDDHKAALLLNQIVYWSDRKKEQGGWFYKSADEWYEEIRLTRYELDRIVPMLKTLGVIETKVRKVGDTPKSHYRVIEEKLEQLIVSICTKGTSPICGKTTSPICGKTTSPICGKTTSPICAKTTSLNVTETTLTENTTENTSTCSAIEPALKINAKRARDLRLDNQAIKAYRAVTHLQVQFAWRESVISAVGDNYAKWEAHVLAWVGRGYNPANISGIVESFDKGLTNGNGKKVPDKQVKIIDEVEEFERQNPGVKFPSSKVGV
jgi:hypothetical protein